MQKMSIVEYNQVSAGGDGLKHGIKKTSSKRTPVPSCRRLAIRPQSNNESVRTKLEKALNQLESSQLTKFTHKRAQTVAEITPSKRRPIANIKLSTVADGRQLSTASSSARSQEDAGRRVYQQLLLNAWRRRRLQVATLTDSSRRLREQLGQLQIQVDVLQKLRESESKRRSESASETERLRHQRDELNELIENMKKESKCRDVKICDLQQQLEETNVITINIKNELLTAKSEISSYETTLRHERRSRELLEEENKELQNRIQEYDKEYVAQLENIRHLKEEIENAELNLDTVNLNNSSLEETKCDLEIKLEKEKDIRDDLEHQFIRLKMKEEKLERKIQQLRKSLSLLSETKKKTMQDNYVLKKTLEELEIALNIEKDKTWWKNMAKCMLKTLDKTAHIMFPAYPKNINKFKNCSDGIDN